MVAICSLSSHLIARVHFHGPVIDPAEFTAQSSTSELISAGSKECSKEAESSERRILHLENTVSPRVRSGRVGYASCSRKALLPDRSCCVV